MGICASKKAADHVAAPAHQASVGTGANAKVEEKLLDKYVLGKVLGQGAFGVVYSCKKKGTREEYAVKMIDQVETPLNEIKLEAEMLKQYAHKSIVKLHDVYYEKVFVCMVLELYKGGDMIEGMQLHWKNKGMLAISVVQNISKMMVDSVSWLHSNNVIHRDLKGDNFLMDRRAIEHQYCRIFLSDFGTVVQCTPEQRLKHKCGTKTYWSPEFYALDYSLPVDIWAIGVIMFGLVTGRFPFKGEDDCKTKPVKCPARTTREGEAFILATLDRDEPKRLTAKKALEHVFLSSIRSAAQVAEDKKLAEDKGEEKGFKGEVREAGANAGVAERRRELVERLNNAHTSKQPGLVMQCSADMLKKGFSTTDQFTERVANFEWWSEEKIEAAHLFNAQEAQRISDMDAIVKSTDVSEEALKQMMQDHQVDISKFGKSGGGKAGAAKEFKDFVAEVQSGQSMLMVDATKHKNVVRVVDVVLLRIRYKADKSEKYLVKTSELYPDSRKRENMNQVVGTKKLPHESARETAMRLLRDRLGIPEKSVSFDWTRKEVFETDEESASYPGVRTVYRKEIFQGNFVSTDAAILAKVHLDVGGDGVFSVTCPKQYCRTYQWFTEQECKDKNVTLRAPQAGHEVSPLVHAPIGYSEEELGEFLKASNVDTSKFGQDKVKTLKEFSDELVRGEAQLIHKDGKIVRMVDVVILKIVNKDGAAIVETTEIFPGQAGAKEVVKEVNRFPAVKRRPDENPFWAAKRVLSKVLKLSENLVEFDTKNCLHLEQNSVSTAYANLPTIYRRLVIPAKLEAVTAG